MHSIPSTISQINLFLRHGTTAVDDTPRKLAGLRLFRARMKFQARVLAVRLAKQTSRISSQTFTRRIPSITITPPPFEFQRLVSRSSKPRRASTIPASYNPHLLGVPGVDGAGMLTDQPYYFVRDRGRSRTRNLHGPRPRPRPHALAVPPGLHQQQPPNRRYAFRREPAYLTRGNGLAPIAELPNCAAPSTQFGT